MSGMSRNVTSVLLSMILSTCLVCEVNAQAPFKNWPRDAELDVETGVSASLLPPGHDGLNYFPDEAIAVLGENPLRFLMVCGNATYLLSGESWASATPVAKILSPGPAGSPDNGYAGIGATFSDEPNNRIVGFYHAEDHEGIGKFSGNGVQGYYGTICVAVMDAGGQEARKLGPAITADKPKVLRGWETEGGPPEAWLAQGVGDPHVCVDKDGKYLLAYYSELSNRLKRGLSICVARSLVSDAGLPGTWEKFYSGRFGEKGIGGHDTALISGRPFGGDAFMPHVTYVKSWRRYVMVFGVFVVAEMRSSPTEIQESGFYVSTSMDGIEWTKPEKALTILPLFFTGHVCAMHPTLILSEASGNAASGMLLYGLSENWGQVPHHLAACPIRLKLGRGKTNGSSTRVTTSAVHNTGKRVTRRPPAKQLIQRTRPKTESQLAFEESLVGNYRLELTNDENGANDPTMTVELHADKTITTSDGRGGTWDTIGKQLIIKIPDIKTSPAIRRKDGILGGTLTNKANGLRFRYKLTKTE